MADPAARPGRWTLYVCDRCGGYGHNNLSIHLTQQCAPADLRQVEVVEARYLEEAVRERDANASAARDLQARAERTERERDAWNTKANRERERAEREGQVTAFGVFIAAMEAEARRGVMSSPALRHLRTARSTLARCAAPGIEEQEEKRG